MLVSTSCITQIAEEELCLCADPEHQSTTAEMSLTTVQSRVQLHHYMHKMLYFLNEGTTIWNYYWQQRFNSALFKIGCYSLCWGGSLMSLVQKMVSRKVHAGMGP